MEGTSAHWSILATQSDAVVRGPSQECITIVGGEDYVGPLVRATAAAAMFAGMVTLVSMQLRTVVGEYLPVLNVIHVLVVTPGVLYVWITCWVRRWFDVHAHTGSGERHLVLREVTRFLFVRARYQVQDSSGVLVGEIVRHEAFDLLRPTWHVRSSTRPQFLTLTRPRARSRLSWLDVASHVGGDWLIVDEKGAALGELVQTDRACRGVARVSLRDTTVDDTTVLVLLLTACLVQYDPIP